MSNIQKYVQKRYNPGGTISLPTMDFTGFESATPELPSMSQQVMPQAQQRTRAGQFLQNIGSKFGADQFNFGVQEMTGGQGFGDLLGGAIKGEGPGAGIVSAVTEGLGSGGGLDVQGIMGKAAGGGGFDPLSMIGSGLDSLADDNDATTYSVGEIGADVAGAAVGVGRMLSGDIIGGGKQLIGEIGDVVGSITNRKKARKEQRAAEKQAKQDYFARQGESVEQSVAASVMGGQQSRAEDAQGSMQAMLDKYSQAGAKARGTIAKHGARLDYEEGGVNEGTRPLDLRTMKYKKGGILEKIKFEDGGEATPNIYEQLMSGQLTANTPMSDEQREAIENPKEPKAVTEHKKKHAGDTAMLSGMATGNPLLTGYGTSIGAGEDIGHHIGVKIASMMPWHKDKDFSDILKKTRLDAGFGLAGGPMKILGKMGKAGDLGTKFSDLAQKTYGAFKTTKAVKTIKNLIGDENIEKIKQFAQDKYQDIKGGKLNNEQLAKAELVKGGKVSFDPMDYYTGGYLKYVKGGMTPGEFSHKTNPLTVVDKQGNDTGMELTGGEGVFDKGAMSKLDKYKATKNYKKAGELVFSEMDSWKKAGTAKYGTRIKEYYG